MKRLRRIGIFGGTFDPFHIGHLAVAHAARAALALEEVRVVPARIPPHRPSQPHASAYHRFAMVALGTVSEPSVVVDDSELSASGPSYTSSTLARLGEIGFRAIELFFITGADAFVEIATWREYPRVLDRAHFIVVARPGRTAASLVQSLPDLASRMREVAPDSRGRTTDLSNPLILLVDVPTPDVSATRIRGAVAEGRSLNGLVPRLVEDHIVRHRLYGASPSLSRAAGPLKAASQLHEQEPV
jgi:nicotinate-nucleotide adenylyltransferase